MTRSSVIRFVARGAFVGAAFAGVARPAAAQEAGIMLGASAPAPMAMTLDDKQIKLSDYIGKKPVVLEFWATWCPLCKQLEPAMQAAREKYADKVTFISVGVENNQSPARQQAYAMEKHIGGLFVFDRESKIVKAYNAPHTSYLVVIDAAGKVVYTGAGGEQDVDAAVSKAFQGMKMGGGQY